MSSGEVDPKAHRIHAARLANRDRAAGERAAWFDEFYRWTEGDEAMVPWADLEPHPLLREDLRPGAWGRCAVVGCGLGDDAEWVAERAESVWAFDVSSTAVKWAQTRWPDTKVVYEVGDLFNLPPEKVGAFDTVIEVYTWQALAPEVRAVAMQATASLAGPEGYLIAVTRLLSEGEEWGPVPWPLLPEELDVLYAEGLLETHRSATNETNAPTVTVWSRSL